MTHFFHLLLVSLLNCVAAAISINQRRVTYYTLFDTTLIILCYKLRTDRTAAPVVSASSSAADCCVVQMVASASSSSPAKPVEMHNVRTSPSICDADPIDGTAGAGWADGMDAIGPPW